MIGDYMIMFTILFVAVLVMGSLIDKEAKRIQRKNSGE
tara:strand:- start:424 stop:537 length:114 start_codon:yes stop_codon:yes gene_type:complete